jgi:hypothetical protein
VGSDGAGGSVRGVTIGPITAICPDPPVLEVGDGAFLVVDPALLGGLKLQDRVIVVWEHEGPLRRAVRITLQGAIPEAIPDSLRTERSSPPPP